MRIVTRALFGAIGTLILCLPAAGQPVTSGSQTIFIKSESWPQTFVIINEEFVPVSGGHGWSCTYPDAEFEEVSVMEYQDVDKQIDDALTYHALQTQTRALAAAAMYQLAYDVAMKVFLNFSPALVRARAANTITLFPASPIINSPILEELLVSNHLSNCPFIGSGPLVNWCGTTTPIG